MSEVVSSYPPAERQYDDLRYSPNDFDPNMEISLDDFKKFFVLEVQSLLGDYGDSNPRLRRYLRQEALHPDQMIDPLYAKICRCIGKQMLTWGNFAKFRERYSSDWDERYGYARPTTSDSPTPSDPSE